MAFFRKLDSGWEYRITYRDQSGKKHEKSKRGFKTKTLAKIAASKVESELNSSVLELMDMLFYDYSKQWAEVYKRPHVTAKTWQTYNKNFRHIKHYFGNKKVKDITHTFYQQVLNDFGALAAQQTLDKFHYQVKGAAKAAVRDGVIKYNFAEGAIVKSQKPRRAKEDMFLEENEYLHLIDVARSKMKYASYFTIYLIAVTGMRFAEVQGLTWKDIDFESGFIDINKTFDYTISQEFAPTKNEASIRKVPVDNRTIELLKVYKNDYYQPNRLERICFGASNNATNKAIKKMVGRTAPTNHSLRHTYASYLIFKGVDLISVSQLLGHENLNITLKIYAHQLEKLKEKNDRVVKDIFSKI
ncbi:site-specific integrase [Streptococcus chenjunshii]|uniref:Site-specific integrase n=1 Tax=Streptococcus chenjunshii TaxID=2173853 RepID=A0A372KLM5_9STRE|nr:site-specific integrase [Streptococcus chenjunshii]AXQ79458.1 site-specific integrase [Streptococcus chenjunshii]RFU51084.1 site-specific integrase [Streptococcus chenjunshii]RFU53182.1 site-specific integrase [Streptococcus chenjunshii]